jgi:hypothetical protein
MLLNFLTSTYLHRYLVVFNTYKFKLVRWQAKKVRHHLNVSVIKALITHLGFDVTEK